MPLTYVRDQKKLDEEMENGYPTIDPMRVKPDTCQYSFSGVLQPFNPSQAGYQPGSLFCQPTIDSSSAWVSDQRDTGESTIDLLVCSAVCGIVLQGYQTHWLTKIKILSSKDGNYWVDHGDFEGAGDATTKFPIFLNEGPIVCRFVKIRVVQCHEWSSARW